jgi:beta-N-acetylhexosaminidase
MIMKKQLIIFAVLAAVILAFCGSGLALAPPGCDIEIETPMVGEIISAPDKTRVLPRGPLTVNFSGTRPADTAWVETTLAGMTLEQKLGQMMIPWYDSSASAGQIAGYGISGCIFSSWNTSGATSVVQAVNNLQSVSPIPLWFAADFECGAGARFGDATVLPMNMAIGAADDESLATQAGWVTAREAWAMGIQIGFGPCVDVNTDPENPVISTRSYGDRADLVARMAEAYVTGAHSVGMLTCLKHYPGHGPTDQDSHLTLPVVNISETGLRDVHIYPYSSLISGGYADLVMSAHVWYTALDPGPDPWPATLSSNAMTDILRTDLGFIGVAISDAFTMAGVSGTLTTEEAVVTAVQNGLDVILIPPDLGDSVNALKDAVIAGDITMARIDQAVRRILTAKSRMWLPENRYRDEAEMWATLKHPSHLAVAENIARESITSFSEEAGVLPLETTDNVLCLRLVDGGIIFNNPARSYTHFTGRLDAALPNFTLGHVDRSLNQSAISGFISLAAGFDKVIVVAYDWKPIMTDDQVDVIDGIIAGPTPLVFISFGSPYHAMKLSGLETHYCGYSNSEPSQRAGADTLLGTLLPLGTPPISTYGYTSVTSWPVY